MQDDTSKAKARIVAVPLINIGKILGIPNHELCLVTLGAQETYTN